MKKILVTALIGCCFFVQATVAQETPKHLQLAREFVLNTKQANNSYSNSKVYTRMPGDLFASEYVVSTDCSGFVEDMVRMTGGGVLAQLTTQKLKF